MTVVKLVPEISFGGYFTVVSIIITLRDFVIEVKFNNDAIILTKPISAV